MVSLHQLRGLRMLTAAVGPVYQVAVSMGAQDNQLEAMPAHAAASRELGPS